MLVVIDMQNQVLDKNSESYIPNSEQLVVKIAKRLEQARKNNEYVLFTKDIPVEYKDSDKENLPELQIIPALTPLAEENVVKKYYYSIPPEFLLDIKKQYFESEDQQKIIEVTGIETNVCVLSNTIELQSAFPEADFIIDQTLVAGKNHEQSALKILKDFNVEIR